MRQSRPAIAARRELDLLIRRDNTFGTPEEDAFRRDFTINALFYDIATFSIIDYVGGLRDLKDGMIRCIGDPDERFREDPVRMLRAVAFAERLGFTLDPPVERCDPAAPAARSRAARRRACSTNTTRSCGRARQSASSARSHGWGCSSRSRRNCSRPASHEALWQSLAEVDAYPRRVSTPCPRR